MIELRPIIEAVEGDQLEQALRLLVAAEWEAFRRGARMAGDLAYARACLGVNDRDGTLAILRQLLARRS